MNLPRQSTIVLSLLVLSVSVSGFELFALSRDMAAPESTRFAWTLTFCTLVTMWARAEAAPRGAEHSSLLVFFLWPVVLAYHLIKTRQSEGLLVYLGFWALFSLPTYVLMVWWFASHAG